MALNYELAIEQHHSFEYLNDCVNFLNNEPLNTLRVSHYYDLAMKIIETSHDYLIDKASSISALKFCAVNGHILSQVALVALYEEGEQVEHDPAQMLFWCSMAVKSGDKKMKALAIKLDPNGNKIVDVQKRLSFQVERYKNWNNPIQR